jgi:hypothetical protein
MEIPRRNTRINEGKAINNKQNAQENTNIRK